jgi:hypothetical protein
MGHYLGSCVLCRNKSMAFYDNSQSKALLERVARIKGQPLPVSPVKSALTIALIVSAVGVASWGVGTMFENTKPAVAAQPLDLQ